MTAIRNTLHSFATTILTLPETNNGCWEWPGTLNEKGYGQLSIGGRSRKTHVWAWMWATGLEVPEGHVIRHDCDNPPCCCPTHLRNGTPKDNARDMVERGRHKNQRKTHCDNGHEFTAENTAIQVKRDGSKTRRCLECGRDYDRRRKNDRAWRAGRFEQPDLFQDVS